MGLPAGASLAFFIASSNFFARMSSLLVSWNQESANLSSRWRFCSARIFWASLRSTFGPAFTGASCESTAPKTGSTVSFAWQHGQVTCRFSLFCFAITVFYANSNSVRIRRLEVGLAEQIGLHATSVVWMNAEIAEISIAQLSQNRDRARIPTGPGEWRVSVHILGIDHGASIEQELDSLLITEGCGAVERRLAFCSAIAHEVAGFHTWLGRRIRICTVGEQYR